MTINEHQEHLLDIMDSMPDDACGDWRDSLVYAIDVIHKYQKLQSDYDKIRAEIEALPKTYPFVNHIDTYVKEDDVKKILDKHRAEWSEE